ncbi:hypothetical protein [uncultured Enterococcus sp.]|uniref:hypothetical protein n=1 Tax=uncultured Enterococcus sp. TaxID=167972 RepID=UPI002AA709D8|nr:hypothetical protein [uncultured Enterococcus sp.]
MMEDRNTDFIGYEYKESTVGGSMEMLFVDSYTSLGWQLVETTTSMHGHGKVALRFKRDRKIRNKGELNRLQRKLDELIEEIERLEFSKITKAAAVAYIVGIVGTAFMAGSVFLYLAGMLLPSIILAIPGFLGWIVPYLLYRSIRQQKTNEINPIIEQRYDEIYRTCEQASTLS